MREIWASVGALNRIAPLMFYLLLAWSITAGCAAENRMPQGIWGGDHVQMQVNSGGANLEFDCAHGSIAEAIVLDEHSKFDLGGTVVLEHPGPVREGEEPKPLPARYHGSVADDNLDLKIILTDSGKECGSVRVTFGRTPRIIKCN
jgi:hypothetical protein